MARVNTVTCPSCGKDYYIERMLSKAMEANPRLKLRCPFCKQEFLPGQESVGADAPGRPDGH
jgi:endogenous inhibitor of DNA gyrase (YacG/DUF329 family)